MKSKSRILVSLATVLVVIGLLVLGIWLNRPKSVTTEGAWTAGGIPFKISVVRGDKTEGEAQQAIDRAIDELDFVNSTMSTYIPASEVGRINSAKAGEAITIHPELMAVLLSAQKISGDSGGAFDPTARPIFLLWKNAIKERREPDYGPIDNDLQYVGWDKLTLADDTVTKSADAVQIDLGGIAKGHAVDRCLAALKGSGAPGGLVEVGGEVAVFGQTPKGDVWSVGIQNPFVAPGICGVLRLDDRAMATSGNYEQSFTIGDKWFSHIIDPRTGRQPDLPAAVASATVVAPDCMSADGWATALSVLGEKGLALIEARPGVEAMLIIGDETDYKVVQTSGFAAMLADGEPVNPNPGK